MFKESLNKLKSEPCLRLDYKAELEDNKAAWHYFRTKYPLLFEGLRSEYFYLPKGWRNLCEAAFAFLNEQGVKLVQVKQKLGDLRLYTEDECEGECARLLNMAEALARGTCEFCSGTNNVGVFNAGYVCRVCEECRVVLCEYTIMNWVLNGKQEQMNEAQLYCVKELRKLNEELSRVANSNS
jgi:hypothetical protein